MSSHPPGQNVLESRREKGRRSSQASRRLRRRGKPRAVDAQAENCGKPKAATTRKAGAAGAGLGYGEMLIRRPSPRK